MFQIFLVMNFICVSRIGDRQWMYMIVEKERIYQTVFSDSWCLKEIVSLLSDPISFE